MPTTRRRRAQRLRPTLSPGIRHYLETGEVAASDDLFEVFRLARGGDRLRVLWADCREDVLDEYVERFPGRRPWAWWRFEAPGDRLRVGGTGIASRDFYPAMLDRGAFGVPKYWHEADVDDPPAFESQATYLDRHGLLDAEERAQLDDDAFEPEEIIALGDPST